MYDKYYMYTKKGSSSAAFGVLTVDALQFGMHNTQCTISSAHLHSLQNGTVCRIAHILEQKFLADPLHSHARYLTHSQYQQCVRLL